MVFFLFLFGLSSKGHALLQVNQVILVDDFEGGDGVNRLGGMSGGDEELPGGCLPRPVTDEEALGETGTSLALDYDVSEPDSFSYFWIKLGKSDLIHGTIDAANFSEMRYLSFWIRSEAGPEAPRLEFFVEIHEDTNGDKRFILGDDVKDRIPASRFAVATNKVGWQKIVIPLSRFRQIHHWDRIVEIVFVFENKWRIGKGTMLLDDLLLGSNYPEEFQGTEIPMQNRVSSFKIDKQIVGSEIKLKKKSSPMTLTLTFVDPYLEEIRFEESGDGGKNWRRIRSFYDHSTGGVYEDEINWEKYPDAKSKDGILVRALGMSLLGGETELAGPYRLRIA